MRKLIMPGNPIKFSLAPISPERLVRAYDWLDRLASTALDEKSAYTALEALRRYMAMVETGDPVQLYYDAVCEEAEKNMVKTGKLEGSHYAAMQRLLPDHRVL